MSEDISNDTLQQLVPLLGGLARLVAKGAQLGDGELRTLLLGVGLESYPLAFTELRRWSLLLRQLHQQPDEVRQQATVEALRVRGVPATAVQAAIATLVSQPDTPKTDTPSARTDTRLSVQPDRLDFGRLPLGQDGEADLVVRGGPGQVLVGHHHLVPQPRRFGVEPTPIHLTVQPIAEGKLATFLKLVTIGQTLEVPVLASWHKPRTTSTTKALMVSPDGSGDFSSLEEALQQIDPGTTLRLAAGVHRLSAPLQLSKAVTLVGTGMERTRLVGDGTDFVVRYHADGTLTASDLTLAYDGRQWATVLTVTAGQVDLQRCRFTGAKRQADSLCGGSGLWFLGDTAGTVRGCEFVNNDWNGVTIHATAKPTLDGNTCHHNAACGIAYFDNATGTAHHNTCTENGLHGIQVAGESRPLLEANSCSDNASCGIVFVDTTQSTARQNVCLHNTQHGMYVTAQTQPVLDGNTCQANGQSGLVYAGLAGGTAQRNICTGNTRYGVQVDDEASPTLEGNTCSRNQQTGLVYSGNATGSAQRNICSANGRHGIQVSEHAQPALDGNSCQNNRACGIAYFGVTGGNAQHNTCTENQLCGLAYFGMANATALHNTCTSNVLHGIQITEQGHPSLLENTCQGNQSCGIAYFGTATGMARLNTCAANGHHGILVAEHAHPDLEDNTCQHNQSCGLAYSDAASGAASRNSCTHNAHEGIHVSLTALPLVKEDNQCQENGRQDIYDQRET